MTTDSIDPPQQRRSRVSLLIVLGLFAAPVLIAWSLFYVFPEWMPSGTINHGDLVEPARPLPDFSMDAFSGDTVDQTYLRGKWNYVYLHAGDCDSNCVQQLYKVRQLRLAHGKNIDRIQRLMLWRADNVTAEARAELQSHFPGQVILMVPENSQLVAAFSTDTADPLLAGRIYLVDPLGNLMMIYQPEAEPRGIIKDMHRLLKYSGLG
jgi:cytochrome oxidase Cu insertion factor (SCO1/SenC/PrrC family)